MEDSITILKPGTWAKLADGEVDCQIISACVWANGHYAYNVVWWDGRVRREACVEPGELVPTNATKPTRIGFASQP